jgi:hypothetical protein
MPIKFRCTQCSQWLGISRSRAGKVVDCPTCGRAVRVPELDGQVKPVPPPKLNLQDSQLSQALDELAMIGQESPDEKPADALEQSSQNQNVIEPALLPEPVPVEPPLPAERVVTPKLPPSEEVSRAAGELSSANHTAEQNRPADSPATPANLVDQSATVDSAAAELAGLAQLSGRRYEFPATSGKSRWRMSFSVPVVVTVVVVAIAGFGLGYVSARNGGEVSAIEKPNDNGSRSTTNGKRDSQPAQSAAPALQGRITYKTPSGGSRPDRGARVLVFPQQRAGQAKLPAAGFRGTGLTADFQVAAAGLRALGGDVAIVDEKGNFTISLPEAGLYQILILSRYQSRDEEKPLEAALIKLLELYFDRPEQLLGRVGYHFGQVRYKGTGTEIWDDSF